MRLLKPRCPVTSSKGEHIPHPAPWVGKCASAKKMAAQVLAFLMNLVSRSFEYQADRRARPRQSLPDCCTLLPCERATQQGALCLVHELAPACA